MEDKLLWTQVAEGSEKAFHHLFTTYFEPLTYHANKLLGDFDLARDVVQEVFTQLYHKREELEINTSIKAYLYRAVHNRSLNELASQKRKKEHHFDIYARGDEDFSADHLEQEEAEFKIWKAFDKLPPECRRIFEMSRIEGKRNAEIAEELNLSIRSVETQVSKALRILRDLLLGVFLLALQKFF